MKTVSEKETLSLFDKLPLRTVNQLFVSKAREREKAHFISNCQILTVRLIQENDLARSYEREALDEYAIVSNNKFLSDTESLSLSSWKRFGESYTLSACTEPVRLIADSGPLNGHTEHCCQQAIA